MNTAIIVAAGTGIRLGSELPKQYIQIDNKPVIRYSLERFDEAPSIDEIVVVVARDEVDRFDRLLKGSAILKPVRVTIGGSTRALSVWNGLESISSDDGIVAVHDAARPLVTTDEIERTIAAAATTGAACLTAAINDTVKALTAGVITSTIDRSTLRRALTPQAFRIELLRRAFAESQLGSHVSDECYLVEKLGHPIASVEGSSRNIKITVADDLLVAKTFLAEQL
ncbi:MAG: 2-C-methyl-D-erythritol 4-phosphate cytidylyltransferase [Pyrinomonadaceae bacterium]